MGPGGRQELVVFPDLRGFRVVRLGFEVVVSPWFVGVEGLAVFIDGLAIGTEGDFRPFGTMGEEDGSQNEGEETEEAFHIDIGTGRGTPIDAGSRRGNHLESAGAMASARARRAAAAAALRFSLSHSAASLRKAAAYSRVASFG